MLKNWQTKKSKNFSFLYPKGSLAEKEIKKINKISEDAYERIAKELNLPDPIKIKYILYPSVEIKKELSGFGGINTAIMQKQEIHTVYNEEKKPIGPHEIAHILSYQIGRPPNLLMEGLSEYFRGSWHGKSFDFWVKKYIKEKEFIYPHDLINQEKWNKFFEKGFKIDRVIYPIAGSFINFLIKKYGIEKFKKTFKALSKNGILDENFDNFQSIYKVSFLGMEEMWLNALKQ